MKISHILSEIFGGFLVVIAAIIWIGIPLSLIFFTIVFTRIAVYEVLLR